MELFKTTKKQPIKLKGFTYIGRHSDYETCIYFYKELGFNNFELAEVMLEGKKLNELGAGTKIQVLDTYMSNYLYMKKEGVEYKDTKDFIKKAITNTYKDAPKHVKEAIVNKFTAKVPSEITRTAEAYKKYIDKGYRVLYCSNDENKERRMGIVNIVLVKDDHVESTDNKIEVMRDYTLFKPLRYMTTPSYIKKESKDKYFEEELPQIVVNNDLLK